MGQNQASQTIFQEEPELGSIPTTFWHPPFCKSGHWCLKPRRGQCQALLGWERSFPKGRVLCSEKAFREIRLLPTRGWQLAPVFLPGTTPFSIIDPHPTPAPTRSCEWLTRGRCCRSHLNCCQGKQTSPRAQCLRERVLLAPSTLKPFPQREKGAVRGPVSPALPSTELWEISPGGGSPYYIHATKVMGDILRNV